MKALRILPLAAFSCACAQAATIEPVAPGLKLVEPFGVFLNLLDGFAVRR